MGDAGFFRGTTAEQDNRFSDKQKKLLKTLQFPAEFAQKVDMKKVNLETIKGWITERINTILESEDEILENFVFNQLECETPDPRHMQINLTGFLNAKKAREFMTELWTMLVSAQDAPDGIPPVLVEQRMRLERELMKIESEKVKREAAAAPTRSPVRSPSVPKRVRSPVDSAERHRHSWNQGRGRDGGRDDSAWRENERGKRGSPKRWKRERSRSRGDDGRRGGDWYRERYGMSEGRNQHRNGDRRRKYHRDSNAHKRSHHSRRTEVHEDQRSPSSSPMRRPAEERQAEPRQPDSSEKAIVPSPRTPSSDADEPVSPSRSETNRERSQPAASVDKRREEDAQADSIAKEENELTKRGKSPYRSSPEGGFVPSPAANDEGNQLLRADERSRRRSDQQKRCCHRKHHRSRSRKRSHTPRHKHAEETARHHASRHHERSSKSPKRSTHSSHARRRSNREEEDMRGHPADVGPSAFGESRSKHHQSTENRRRRNVSGERYPQEEENKDSLSARGRHATSDGRRHRNRSRSSRKALDRARDGRPTSNHNERVSLVEYGSNDSLDGVEEKGHDLADSGKRGKEGKRHKRKRGIDKEECMKYLSKKQMKELRAQYLSTDTSEVSDEDLVQNFPVSYSSEGSSENKDLTDSRAAAGNEAVELTLPRSYQKHQAFIEKGSKKEEEKEGTNSAAAKSSKRHDSEKARQPVGKHNNPSSSAEKRSKREERSAYNPGDERGKPEVNVRKRRKSAEKKPKDKKRKKSKKSSKTKHEKRAREQSLSDNGEANSESEKLRSIALKSLRSRNN